MATEVVAVLAPSLLSGEPEVWLPSEDLDRAGFRVIIFGFSPNLSLSVFCFRRLILFQYNQ